jgi:hypothetical protein
LRHSRGFSTLCKNQALGPGCEGTWNTKSEMSFKMPHAIQDAGEMEGSALQMQYWQRAGKMLTIITSYICSKSEPSSDFSAAQFLWAGGHLPWMHACVTYPMEGRPQSPSILQSESTSLSNILLVLPSSINPIPSPGSANTNPYVLSIKRSASEINDGQRRAQLTNGKINASQEASPRPVQCKHRVRWPPWRQLSGLISAPAEILAVAATCRCLRAEI